MLTENSKKEEGRKKQDNKKDSQGILALFCSLLVFAHCYK